MTTRELFQTTGNTVAHKAWAEGAAGEMACAFALAELANKQTGGPVGMEAGARIEGAKAFIEILLKLHKPDEERKPTRMTQLNPPK